MENKYSIIRHFYNGEDFVVLSTSDEVLAKECFYDEHNDIEGHLLSGYNKAVPYAVTKLQLLQNDAVICEYSYHYM